MLNASEIQDWLITQVAALLHIAPTTLDVDEPFANYGLSSRDAVSLSGDLEVLLGRRLSPTLVYEYPSISLLSRYLGTHTENREPLLQQNAISVNAVEPVAVIGIACRFPGAKDPALFWELLRNGVDAITEVPADRWNVKDFYDPDPAVPGKAVSRWGGFLENIDRFDPFFFGISPVEAEYMDPQQRLLMELSYEALDDAGLAKAQLAGTDTGVFVGISINEYSQLQFSNPSLIISHSGTGNALSVAANRISYFFDFHGPSMAIDTACSSSLAAVHLACQSIRSGECGMALAGGVNMILSPAHAIAFTKAGVLSHDGQCKAFDAGADGYVRGEGGGVVVLKKLSAALKDGDRIYALVQGSAIHQDGRTNGLMAPNREAQEALLREAYQAAGIAPGNVQYVETHGTGTLLGDSMEAAALGNVIGANRTNGACAIGSVKSNIGHLEAAAGIAGLIKVILSIKHQALAASLHYQSPNPHIPFDALHLRVQEKLTAWPAGTGPAIAGVSSFGFGGTLVHVVVSGAEQISQDKKHSQQLHAVDSGYYLLPLSADSDASLQSIAGSFRELLASDGADHIKDSCYAAGLRRSGYDYRLAAIGRSREEMCSRLDAFLHQQPDPHIIVGNVATNQQPRLAFVFSGQGGQWFGMGRALLQQQPVFYKAIAQIDQIIQVNYGWSLLDELIVEQSLSRLSNIAVVQPALFAIQVALAGLWQSWGITPDAVVGHSMGEVAAAHVAGMLTLEEAIQVVCSRSLLLQQLQGKGSMLVTELSPEEAGTLLKGFGNGIAIAVINSPASTVLSGDSETVNNVMEYLQEQHVFCKLVNVDVASHSPQIDILRTELLNVLDGLHPRPARLPFYSTVTGKRADNLYVNADYWIDNLRKPVLFYDAIGQLLDSGHSTFLEIGPHPVLLGAIQQTLQLRGMEGRLLPSLRRETPEQLVLFTTLGTLYTDGYSVAWNSVYPSGRKYAQLPAVSWQRQRYWIDATTAAPEKPLQSPQLNGGHFHQLLGAKIRLANAPSTFVWQTAIDIKTLHYLTDHRVDDELLLPAAAYIEMALRVAKETGIQQSHELADVVFKEKMVLQNDHPLMVQVHLSPGKEDGFLFSVYSQACSDQQWVLHATATFVKTLAAGRTEQVKIPDEIMQLQSETGYAAEALYRGLSERGLQYGPAFRGIEYAWYRHNKALARIGLPGPLLQDNAAYLVHPALMDACLQVLAATPTAAGSDDLYIPAGCSRVRFFPQAGRVRWSHVSLQPETAPGEIYADFLLLDEHHQPVAELTGFRLQHIKRQARRVMSFPDISLYQQQWKEKAMPTALLHPVREQRHWLIFADDTGAGDALATQLEAAGDSCYMLHYSAISSISNSTDKTMSFAEILEKILQETPVPFYGVIHMWSLVLDQYPEDIHPDIMQMPGCNSTLLLVQALANRIAGMPRLWLVTKGAQPVTPGYAVAVAQSALWGLAKVISFELPECRCTRIDLDPQQAIANAIPLLHKQLLQDDGEDQVAFRDGIRYVLRLLPYQLTYDPGSPGIILKADATYLVTGGLGALGLAVAQWMFAQGARNMVLLGRRAPSQPAMRIVQQLQQAGATIVVEQADVANREQVEAVMQHIAAQMPPLRGIIHAAGVLDDGALLNLDAERLKTVMLPKVNGTWNLHHATMKLPLDFFVLFSSAVSVLGSPGQGNYAAASAYLDAIAYYRRHLGLPAISINWGPWADAGLAAEAAERLKAQQASTQHLVKVIAVEQGLHILEHLLNGPAPQVVVLPFDLRNLLELYPAAAGMPFFAAIGGSNTHVARRYTRPNLRQQYVEPRNEIERKLAALWRQTLHIDRVGVQDSFFELGGDSVLAAQILALAQKAFGIRINPQDAFKAFTIERLAEMLEAEFLKQIEAMSEDEAQQLMAKQTNG